MDNCRSERLSGYHELVHYALPFGEGPGLSAIREQIDHLDLTPEERREVAELDEIVIEELGYRDWIDDYVLRDDPTQPLSRWWWRLGQLRAGVYPAELLPRHLREIYRQHVIHGRLMAGATPT